MNAPLPAITVQVFLGATGTRYEYIHPDSYYSVFRIEGLVLGDCWSSDGLGGGGRPSGLGDQAPWDCWSTSLARVA